MKFDEIKNDKEVAVYLKTADDNFRAIGFKDHGLRHAAVSSFAAGYVLESLGYPEIEVEHAKIAGYLHDIGNAISQEDHAQIGAVLSLNLMENKMPYDDIIKIISAVGSHEDKGLDPVSPVCAAVILGDKSDVHRARVRQKDLSRFDSHDMVNYACLNSAVSVERAERMIYLRLDVDENICPIMEFFDTFLARIKFCRQAAKYLGCGFDFYINNSRM
ncbi:MAG: HD domain-containing protein [Endomicrobiia bacterium]|nr:HD domain-containing protein [Endomicrobiia bacterium]